MIKGTGSLMKRACFFVFGVGPAKGLRLYDIATYILLLPDEGRSPDAAVAVTPGR